jgi:predicted dehydrogenase
MLEELQSSPPAAGLRRARLGFAGVGWIGRQRLQAAASSGMAEVVAVMDLEKAAAEEVAAGHPGSAAVDSFGELLDQDLDGLVIATPSALHAAQSIAALERGIPVFCQKPLGRNAAETEAVIQAAEQADCLLGVDLSYRSTEGMRKIRDLVHRGDLGEIRAIQAVFHNAYGPDKPWFYSKQLAGGGCLLDLGIHLLDLAMGCLDFPEVRSACGWRHESARGKPGDRVEDHGCGLVVLEQGTSIQLACSWRSHAGCDAEIRLEIFGSDGGACFRNVGGSFYDFIAERFHPDRSRELLAEAPDDWGGRELLKWLHHLNRSAGFDPQISNLTKVARTLDRLSE